MCVSIVRTMPCPEPLGLVEDRLDREVRVDDDRFAGLLAAHEVRGAPQVVVQDLREEHAARP